MFRKKKLQKEQKNLNKGIIKRGLRGPRFFQRKGKDDDYNDFVGYGRNAP